MQFGDGLRVEQIQLEGCVCVMEIPTAQQISINEVTAGSLLLDSLTSIGLLELWFRCSFSTVVIRYDFSRPIGELAFNPPLSSLRDLL
jgi:hypothetical protein